MASLSLSVLAAAAGDRPAPGRIADGEEPAAQAHTEAAGSPAPGQTERQTQTHQQTEGRTHSFHTVPYIIFYAFCQCQWI